MASPVKVREVPSVDGRDPFVIGFYEKPYHSYRMGTLEDVQAATADRVPSVTQAIGVLDKSGPLVGWAVNLTLQGAWTMVRDGYEMPGHWRTFQSDMRAAGLDHNATVTDAQFRGTAVHALHEAWVDEQKIPNPADYPEHWRGYVRSYAAFLMALRNVQFEVAEVLVGSRRHGFAGMCDTVALIERKDGRRERWDFKSSKGCYPSSHFPQLAAYELGAVECGDEPTDRQAIILISADGTFDPGRDIHYSTATADDFLVLLAAFKSQAPFKAAERKAYNAKRRAGTR